MISSNISAQSPNLPLADCMSFSCNLKTLRSGNSYDLRAQPGMTAHGDENAGEVETGIFEGSEENSIKFSPELVDERIKASLEPLHAQISALTEMMDRLIQSNSTAESTTASSRGPRHQCESPYSERPGSFKFPTVAPLATAEYSPDIQSSGIFDQCFWPQSYDVFFIDTVFFY